jgi:Kef-type K+ transport system membrane component KefB
VTSHDFVKFALQIAVMLGVAVLCGQGMRRIKQPAVLGEIIGGIMLGPTVVGLLVPDLWEWLFRSSASAAHVREASIKLGMLFFLFIAGAETNLSDLRKVGRQAALIGSVGTVVPLAAGLALVYALPRDLWGEAVQAHFFAFALFVGMNLANSANPVLARILLDLGLLRGGIGTLCMTATIIDDLVNWTVFAIILRDMAPSGAVGPASLPMSLALVALVFVLILGIGRWLGPPALRRLKGHVTWPSGVIAVHAVIILVAACVTESLGIHAFLGAFLAGAALGGQGDAHKEVHGVMTQFALSFFAPIYFVSMGLTTNYITHFEWALVLVMVTAALVSKLAGVLCGIWLARMPIDRDAWAIAFGLNARGATGIILAGVGRAAGVIDDRIFVAIVVMALVTSILAGPVMNWLLSDRMAEARVAGRPVANAGD